MLTNHLVNTIIVMAVAFCGGFITGYITRDFRLMITGNLDRDNGSVVLLVVTAVWAVSMLVDIISPNYETSPLVHGLMGAIVGYFYRPKINDKSPKTD